VNSQCVCKCVSFLSLYIYLSSGKTEKTNSSPRCGVQRQDKRENDFQLFFLWRKLFNFKFKFKWHFYCLILERTLLYVCVYIRKEKRECWYCCCCFSSCRYHVCNNKSSSPAAATQYTHIHTYKQTQPGDHNRQSRQVITKLWCRLFRYKCKKKKKEKNKKPWDDKEWKEKRKEHWNEIRFF
jgi:hypothetical protein